MVIAPAVPGHRHAVRHHLPRACPELRRAGPLGVEPGILGVLQLADERAIDGGRAGHARSVRGWPGAGSNCRHRGFQPRALPTELPGPAPVMPGSDRPPSSSPARSSVTKRGHPGSATPILREMERLRRREFQEPEGLRPARFEAGLGLIVLTIFASTFASEI